MSSGLRRVMSEHTNRLKKRKLRKRPMNRYDEETRRASMLMLLQLFIALGGDMKLLATLMLGSSESALPEIENLSDLHIYSKGIILLGVDKFLSTAVAFCHEIARAGRMPIVSVGSGDGSIERKIEEAYRERYGAHSRLDIILVDPDPKYKGKVHFEYVDDLIEKRPSIVGHCAVFIFWPVEYAANFDKYDIEAVRSLQPHGVLTVYESGGGSGSSDFVRFLRSGSDDFALSWEEMGLWNHQGLACVIEEECDSYGLDNYEVYEVAQRRTYEDVFTGTLVQRMAVARRVDFHFGNSCPAINWTCKRRELEFRQFLSSREESLGRAIQPSEVLQNIHQFNIESMN